MDLADLIGCLEQTPFRFHFLFLAQHPPPVPQRRPEEAEHGFHRFAAMSIPLLVLGFRKSCPRRGQQLRVLSDGQRPVLPTWVGETPLPLRACSTRRLRPVEGDHLPLHLTLTLGCQPIAFWAAIDVALHGVLELDRAAPPRTR